MSQEKTLPQSSPHGAAHLKQLLSERNQYPARSAEIDAQIRSSFERKVAILALDMCGFSKLTAQHGIIHFLAMIHQMNKAARPAILANGGHVVKQEADNLFAYFATAEQALEAALDIFRAFESMNAVLPDERDIYGSIGIGHGETLIVGEHDMFGAEMNEACKLGEDVAGKMEILLTRSAYQTLPTTKYLCNADSVALNDFSIDFYRFEKRIFAQ